MTTPRRPIIRYHGGKWKLADWVIPHFPNHRVYVEPFGGAASVLLKKPRSYAEVYNDLDGEIVNLFMIARDHGQELERALRLTPFSRSEYLAAWHPSDHPLERARRTVIRAFMGFGSAAATMRRAGKSTVRGGLASTGFRANSNRSGTTPAGDWKNYPDALRDIVTRLQGVVIENKDAFDVIRKHDGPKTLHYIDPPYVQKTRDAGDDYAFELTDEDHCRLAELLLSLKGMVVVSGYRSDLYDELFIRWQRIDRRAYADGAKPRIECLWLSPSCPAPGLFGGAA